MGCPCENEQPIYNIDAMTNIEQEIVKRARAGFDVNRIAAGLMVSKAYVEEVLAPKPVVKTPKKRKSTSTKEE